MHVIKNCKIISNILKKLKKVTIFTWRRSIILLQKGGVNCQVCWRLSPSKSRIMHAPQTCVQLSSIASSTKSIAPFNISSSWTSLCFHFSVIVIRVNYSIYHLHIEIILRKFTHIFSGIFCWEMRCFHISNIWSTKKVFSNSEEND